ncbi:uncharacterized protein LOC129234147 [Uloborus diversus]|uniref:uncharacterized protein LOC129234147 n=1 Tax=Uloborus diversus TaxID=327109 RepID=UPI002409B49F|nr:uncharacterized protein LOC129234147 [Uloborus diversus]
MEVAPPSKSRPRPSSRARSCKSGGAGRRPPSPDSACEHDANGAEDDMSEEGGKPRKAGSGLLRRKYGDVLKGAAAQDSDVDSGIVACRKPGERISSTSSADTDSSQESRRRIEYSPPVQKNDIVKSRSCNGSLRAPKRSSCQLPQTNTPLKADHSALKECNRRPPTPLTVFPDSHHCVRFDEQLQLSEQNIRRSCRKLFATLYAQRFSCPDGTTLPLRSAGSTRIRSRTAPELDLRRAYSPASSVRESHRYDRSHKESPVAVEGRRVGNNLVWNNRSMPEVNRRVLPSPQVPRHILKIQSKLSMEYPDIRTTQNISADSGFSSYGGSSTHCTCNSRQSNMCLCSSQLASTSYHCTCHRCCCSEQQQQQQPAARTLEQTAGLFKSNSCSTLPNVLSHQSRPQLTQFPPRTSSRRPSSQSEMDIKLSPLQKTSSYSNLLERTSFAMSNVPVYSDNMVQVYAKLVPVVPDEGKTHSASQGGRRARTISRIRCGPENIYDSIRPSSANTLRSSKSEPVSRRTENESTLTAELSKDLESLRASRESDSKSTHSADIYSEPNKIASGRTSLRESAQNRTYGGQRPKSIGVVSPSCGPNPVYLKSALKKSTQEAMQNMSTSNSALDAGLVEVEYAVVDKSKKNNFASMPALNKGSSGVAESADDEDKDPPVPPKKLLQTSGPGLCKSDFSVYRSGSSKRASLMERMQTLTRNAKSALQKAFSTERIYRPEKEERLEATGHKLQRSKSFMRTLAGSLRRKKKQKNSSKGLVAEMVPQASSNPEWDEQPTGPNTCIHVRGQLLQLNLDGSQVVELTKPPSKPYGFFVARGRVRNSKGVFVSRMRDQETQKHLAGLLDIGDEILEIDGHNVKNADIMEVNSLMSNRNTLLLTVLPYICRKDT